MQWPRHVHKTLDSTSPHPSLFRCVPVPSRTEHAIVNDQLQLLCVNYVHCREKLLRPRLRTALLYGIKNKIFRGSFDNMSTYLKLNTRPPTQACDFPCHVQVYGTRMDFPLWRRPHIQPESGCFSHSSHGSIVPGSMTRLADQYYNTLGKIIGVFPSPSSLQTTQHYERCCREGVS